MSLLNDERTIRKTNLFTKTSNEQFSISTIQTWITHLKNMLSNREKIVCRTKDDRTKLNKEFLERKRKKMNKKQEKYKKNVRLLSFWLVFNSNFPNFTGNLNPNVYWMAEIRLFKWTFCLFSIKPQIVLFEQMKKLIFIFGLLSFSKFDY